MFRPLSSPELLHVVKPQIKHNQRHIISWKKFIVWWKKLSVMLDVSKKLPGKKMCFCTYVEPYCKLIVTGQNFAYHKDDFPWRPSIYPWPHWWHPRWKIPLENPWKHHFWDSKFQNDPWCCSLQELAPLVQVPKPPISLLLKNFLTALGSPLTKEWMKFSCNYWNFKRCVGS